MKTPDRKMLTLIAAVVAVFVVLTAGVGALSHVGLMPQFDRVSGSLFIALFWILILIVLPVTFAKGLFWAARSRRAGDNSHFEVRNIPKDELRPHMHYTLDEHDRIGDGRRTINPGTAHS